MTSECTTCRGGGLIGSGDQPWLKLGAVVTCKECGGTGQIGEVESAPAEIIPGNVPVEASPEIPVDNSSSNFSEGSSDGSQAEVNPEVVPVEPINTGTHSEAPETPAESPATEPEQIVDGGDSEVVPSE